MSCEKRAIRNRKLSFCGVYVRSYIFFPIILHIHTHTILCYIYACVCINVRQDFDCDQITRDVEHNLLLSIYLFFSCVCVFVSHLYNKKDFMWHVIRLYSVKHFTFKRLVNTSVSAFLFLLLSLFVFIENQSTLRGGCLIKIFFSKTLKIFTCFVFFEEIQNKNLYRIIFCSVSDRQPHSVLNDFVMFSQ